MLSKQQLFDRKEWLQRLKANVLARKVVRFNLSPKGASLAEVRTYLGGRFEAQESGGVVTVAVRQTVSA